METHEITGTVIDCDYVVEQQQPCIRLFVKDTKTQESYIMYDNSFVPYFYVVPYSHLTSEQMFLLKKKIELFEHKDSDEVIKVKSVIEEEKFIGTQERSVLKVECFIPKDVPRIKSYLEKEEEIEGFREYDILFYKRYLINKKIDLFKEMLFKTHIDKKNKKMIVDSIEDYRASSVVDFATFKWLAFDLETIEENNKTKIIFASILTNDGYKAVLSRHKNDFEHSIIVEDEKKLIEKMNEVIAEQNPDFVLTYNGDGFDFNVLFDRAKTYGIKLKWTKMGESYNYHANGATKKARCFGQVHLDIYKFISYIMRGTIKTQTLKLNNVAEELLDMKKKDVSYSDIKKAWASKTGLDKIADYCLQDSLLTIKLGEYIYDNLSSLCNLTSTLPFDTCRSRYGSLVEAFALKKTHSKNTLVPNKPSNEEIVKRKQMGLFKGAFVYEPKTGLKKNIFLFDFRSLYPSIIITHNIDPSTINCACCEEIKEKKNKAPDYDFYFCEENKGFIPSILEEILNNRIKIKSMMKKTHDDVLHGQLNAQQYALKIVANAFYGYMGFAGSRYYDRRCSASTTSFGRYYIHMVIDEANKEGFKVVYGDTDSVFLSLPSKNMKKTKLFLESINNNLPGIMNLEYEGFFTRGLFARKKHGDTAAKKRYALVDEQGTMIIKGFEKVRKDWSLLAKETQEKILGLILNDKKDEAKKYVRGVIELLKNKKISIDELVINTSIRKNIASYEQMAPHVMAVKKAIAHGMKFKGGQNVAYVITAHGKSISDKAQLTEFAKDYDSQYYVNNQILPAVIRIFEAAGIQETSLTDNTKQKNIFDY